MIDLLAQSATGLEGRLGTLLENPFIVILVLAVSFVAIMASLQAKRKLLVFAYCFCLMFSGHILQVVDSGTTLVRWALIGCLTLSATKGYRPQGVLCSMLGIYWTFSAVSTLWSDSPRIGLQLSGLSFLLCVPAAMALSDEYGKDYEFDFFPKFMNWVAVVYILNATATFSGLTGARFSGSITSAPLFVITGGLLMPCLLWGALEAKTRVGLLVHVIQFAAIFGLCFISGQRTGFFAGLIGCLPLMTRLLSQRAVYAMFALVVAWIVGWMGIQLFPDQATFISERYLTTDVTHRDEVWLGSLELIYENPILGYGAGSHSKIGFGIHNAFLQEWYNGGIFGLFLFFGAFVWGGYKSLKMSLDESLPPEALNLARLCLGWVVTLSATAFFESKLTSPSNVLAFCTVNVGLMIHHLNLRYYLGWTTLERMQELENVTLSDRHI
jgi:hypothetical protein